MRVLKVIDTLSVGGAERVFIDISNLLHESNKIHIDICIIEGKGELDSQLHENLTIYYLNRSKIGFLKTLFKLRKLSMNYDLIHVHMRHVYKFVALSNYGSSKKILFQDHYGSIGIDRSISSFIRYVFPPKFYVGVSNDLCEWAKYKFKKSCEVFLLENIVIPIPIKASRPSKSKIVCVGNIKPIKNQLFALKLITKINLDIDFYGNFQNLKYQEEIFQFIKNNNLQGRVNFIQNVKEVQPVLNNYLFGLSCSKSESGPLVLLEYLAQGIPFLSFSTGSVFNRLSDSYPEFFCESFDELEWINKMKNLKNFDSIDCKTILEENYSPNQYISECLKIYSQILYS